MTADCENNCPTVKKKLLFLNHCCDIKNKAKYISKHFSITVSLQCTPQARKKYCTHITCRHSCYKVIGVTERQTDAACNHDNDNVESVTLHVKYVNIANISAYWVDMEAKDCCR